MLWFLTNVSWLRTWIQLKRLETSPDRWRQTRTRAVQILLYFFPCVFQPGVPHLNKMAKIHRKKTTQADSAGHYLSCWHTSVSVWCSSAICNPVLTLIATTSNKANRSHSFLMVAEQHWATWHDELPGDKNRHNLATKKSLAKFRDERQPIRGKMFSSYILSLWNFSSTVVPILAF